MSFPAIEISKVANFINGFAFKPEDWEDSGLPIIRIQNLTDSTKPYNFTTKKVPKKYLVRKGDILVSWSATIDVFEWERDDAILNQHIFKVEFDQDRIDKHYFKKALQKTIFDLSRYAHGSTMKHVVKKDFESHKIPLPSIADQKRIAYLLGKVEGLIAQRKQHLQHLDDLLKSIFLEMFGDPVRNEKGWEKKPLSQLGNLDRGVSKHRPRNAPELLGGKYPLIQTGNVSNSGTYITAYTQTYSELGFKQSKLWPAGTLCITIAANIAQTGILGFDACFPDSVVGFLAYEAESNALYVLGLFWFFQRILEKNAPAAAQKNINLKILRELDVPAPPPELQNQFAAIVEKVEGIKSFYQQSLTDLETLYGALSQTAFKGELDLSRVPLPLDDPEAIADPPATNQLPHTADTFHLPAPSDLATLNSPEGRTALLDHWLTLWLERLNNTSFSTQPFIDAAQQRLWELAEQDGELAEEDALELGAADYDYVRLWISESLERRHLAQTYNDDKNRVQLKAVSHR